MAQENKYKLNLLTTDFPMRAGLDKKAGAIIKKWQQEVYITEQREKIIGRYNILRHLAKEKNLEKFILHDGPPYANGELHLGHAVNKILKDIIIRYKTILGYDAPYIPGWDCHGLPIELNVEKLLASTGANQNFLKRASRRYASGQIADQKSDFKSLGVIANWEQPYQTMDKTTEAATVKAVADLAEQGYLEQGYKPVHWCLDCQSALAEAEVEYTDSNIESLYVKFPLTVKSATKLKKTLKDQGAPLTSEDEGRGIDLLTWTTTPYTLPGNQAIAIGADIEYILVESGEKNSSFFIMSANFLEIFDQKYNKFSLTKVADIKVADLVNLKYLNMFNESKSVIIAEHVIDKGTGLVHTAPAHGMEDFIACKQAELTREEVNFDYSSPITNQGYYHDEIQKKYKQQVDEIKKNDLKNWYHERQLESIGEYIDNGFPHIRDLMNTEIRWHSQGIIITLLELKNYLVKVRGKDKNEDNSILTDKITHRSTICWRHKTPLLMMATPQWFIGLDKKPKQHSNLKNKNKTLRQLAINAVKKEIKFTPDWGQSRLLAMVQNRPDWCLSRQRNWGNPLPFIISKDTGQPLAKLSNSSKVEAKFDTWYLDDIIDNISINGIEGWQQLDLEQSILQPDISQQYKKSTDTIDVWFDSGATIATVVNQRPEFISNSVNNSISSENTNFIQADLYLEGSDQHRGWFQSSLLISLALYGQAPYKQLLTHGFLVDDKGNKMSKSVGNIISIKEANKQYGPELIRLWVAASDYANDIAYSSEIMQRITDYYRRIRNTIRFFLINLEDFCFHNDCIDYQDMLAVDKYALHNFVQVANKMQQHYQQYQFHLFIQDLVTYCSENLGGFYLDVLKDRLYTLKPKSAARRSAQTALYLIIHDLLLLISPILAFTADEAWQSLWGRQGSSGQDLSTISPIYNNYNDKSLVMAKVANHEFCSESWHQLLTIRSAVLKQLETARSENKIGSSLQAEITLELADEAYNKFLDIFNIEQQDREEWMLKLEQELKFIFIVSQVKLNLFPKDINTNNHYGKITVKASIHSKCDRCWHYDSSVGNNKEYPSCCQRCVENMS